jgi:hypothetical protein
LWEPTQEYPSHDDDLYLDASEMAMLEFLVLCDSSGAHHGFYGDLKSTSSNVIETTCKKRIHCFQGKGTRFIS